MNDINSTLRAQWHAMEEYSPLAALERAGTTRWTIDSVIAAGSINWLVAPPENFKTFVTLDMATCIASGRDWHGKATDQSIVVYLAAEGGNDIHVRRAAADIAAGETGFVLLKQSRPRLDDETGLYWLLGLLNRGPNERADDFKETENVYELIDEGGFLSQQEKEEYDSLDWTNPKHKQRLEILNNLNQGRVPANIKAAYDGLSENHPYLISDQWRSTGNDGYLRLGNIVTPNAVFSRVFLVIDTYSQTSSNDDKTTVSRYIKTLRDLQEKSTAAGFTITVLVIDHMTKSGDSYMGSLAKEGDSDAMFEIDRPGDGYSVTFKCKKMKMAAHFEPVHLDLLPIEIEGFQDALGRPLTSLYVTDGAKSHQVRKIAGSDKDTAAALVYRLAQDSPQPLSDTVLRDNYTAHASNQGKQRESVHRQYRRAIDKLTKNGAIQADKHGLLFTTARPS
jgi:hypothetical protein